MEYENVFKSVGVVLIGVIAYFSLLGFWNLEYGQNVGNSSRATYDHVQSLANSSLFDLGTGSAGNTQTESGAGQDDPNRDLLTRALSVVTAIPELFGLVPALLQDGASILGIPPSYVNIGIYTFLFSAAILFAYLLLIGVRRLL